MLTIETIEHLGDAQAINAAADAVEAAMGSAVPLPERFKLHDLEAYAEIRRRARGVMRTEALADFAAYTETHAELGATVFVNGTAMQACAVLNLGAPEQAGHADNLAIYEPPRTAAYCALLRAATGHARPQREVAEFLEDWLALAEIAFDAEGELVPAARAVAAVRSITVDKARKVEAKEQSLGATRSAFESVQASSASTLPNWVRFTCEPHLGLAKRTFVLRLGVITEDAPKVVLRIVNAEQHAQELAAELAEQVRGAVKLPVVVGSYSAKA